MQHRYLTCFAAINVATLINFQLLLKFGNILQIKIHWDWPAVSDGIRGGQAT